MKLINPRKIGRIGGRSKSANKINAARENGKLGGRPKLTKPLILLIENDVEKISENS